MANLGKVTFTGASGRKYTFDYWDFPCILDEDPGIYIIAQFDRVQHRIFSIYIGETRNLKERLTDHPKQECFNKYKANVLCWLRFANQQNRLAIEADLIENYKPPCND